YEEQLTWGITRLRPEQLEVCVRESHSDERILAGVPYRGAVEAVREWHERGHFVRIQSNRAEGCRHATGAWLEAIGLPFDELRCEPQRAEMWQEQGIELLIDDSPMSIVGALERGIVAATLVHPWNEEVCEEEDVICARDWHELAQLLAPLTSSPTPAERVGAGRA
ncbi:MAG TPA: hypothetical protein VNY52_13710, partial [Solirubrobacteraceae bacterium]|nr:hypothetical protein [Solirubrobacteraceae bacterium]